MRKKRSTPHISFYVRPIYKEYMDSLKNEFGLNTSQLLQHLIAQAYALHESKNEEKKKTEIINSISKFFSEKTEIHSTL